MLRAIMEQVDNMQEQMGSGNREMEMLIKKIIRKYQKSKTL